MRVRSSNQARFFDATPPHNTRQSATLRTFERRWYEWPRSAPKSAELNQQAATGTIVFFRQNTGRTARRKSSAHTSSIIYPSQRTTNCTTMCSEMCQNLRLRL